MQQSDLLHLIKNLRPDEHAELLLFTASPVFMKAKQSKLTQQLLRVILDFAPDFSSEALTKELIYKKMFPREKYVSGRLEKLMVELNKKIHLFLNIQYYLRDDNEFQRKLDLAINLKERQLEWKYQQMISVLKTQQQNNYIDNIKFYREQFLLELEIHEWENLHNKRKGDINIPNVIHALDLFYLNTRLAMQNLLLLQQKATQLPPTAQLDNALEELHIPERYLETSAVLLVTQKIQSVLRNETISTAQFYALVQVVNTHEATIPADLLKDFYSYLRSICISIIQSGNYKFWSVYHDIIQISLEKNYLHYDGKLAPSVFFNIVHASVNSKQFEWLKTFLETNKDLIAGDTEKREYYLFNLAYFHFYTGNFSQALELIPETFQDLYYYFNSRRLELMAYYELKSELATYKISAYKMLISRTGAKQFPASYLVSQSNFINVLLQIFNSAPGDKERSQQLVQRIDSKPFIAEREWLLEKARQIARF